MPVIKAEILRDMTKVPTIVTIQRGRRKLKVSFDADKGFEIEGRSALLPSFSEILRMIYPVTAVISVRGMEWFDRNPKLVGAWYVDDDIAPHASTTVETYVVPADRLALVSVLDIDIVRSAATTTLKRAMGRIVVSGALAFSCFHWNDTVGHRESKASNSNLVLQSGESIQIVTEDLSTGGTLDYRISMPLIEFDV